MCNTMDDRQARREPLRGPGNHYREALSQYHSVRAEMEETWGGVSPHHLTRDLGERRKLSQRGPGGAPAENGFWCILSLKKRIW